MRIILRISRPRIVRRIGLNGGGGGGGVSDHDDLGQLGWTVGAHTGSALGLAGWDADGAAAVVASTSFGRSLLNAADAAAGRTALDAAQAGLWTEAGIVGAGSPDGSGLAGWTEAGAPIVIAGAGYGYLTRNAFGTFTVRQIQGTYPIQITDGGTTVGDTTVGVAYAGEASSGVVIFAASGSTAAQYAVQGSDARLAKGTAFALLQLNADAAWTNQPAADTELFGTERARVIATLTGYTNARILVRRGTGGATRGATLRAQYTTDLTGATGWANLGASVDMTAANVRAISSNTAIAAGAIAGSPVLLRAVGAGGNGVDDPTISQVQIEVS